MIDAGPALHRNDQSERVAQLRRRLSQSGDLYGQPTSRVDEAVFDSTLTEAVLQFQKRHGLEADGVVGAATLEALNVPVETRIIQIKNNLERWRWLIEDLGRVHIIVNIAAFEMGVFEDGSEVFSKRVIVGRRYRRTPVFSGNMTYLVLSPYWHVPRRLAVQDKLPAIKKDPLYLRQQGLRVLAANEEREIDPATIDWSGMTPEDFVYRLRQDPGELNALGKVKFMFPNQFNVYLHDTPSRELFSKADRAFSSGCIRVEHPLDLAEYLLEKDPVWSRERIETVAGSRKETTVMLAEPVRVHIQYWTAWADSAGIVHFRNDVYQRDPALADALAKRAPTRL